MLAPIIHILPITVIQRERLLPVPGKVVVRKMQKVSASDVIAVADLAPEHIILNIARGLGVSIQEADNLIHCKVDDYLNEGDLVAGPVGLTRSVVRSPSKGRVMMVGDGRVFIQLDREPFELHAGYVGIVTKLIPDFGAVVETTGALIQGFWGNGLADFGLMSVKINNPDDELTESQIDVSLRGMILMGGYCNDPSVFQKAAEVPIKGLILTSMPSSMVSMAKKMTYPIIIIEGFGRLPLNPISFNLLTTHQSREISINAEAFNVMEGRRPEVVIPLPSVRDLDLPLVGEQFSVGQQVRVVRRPYQARTGRLDILYNGLVDFPNGIKAPGAQIRFDNGEKVKVPLVNLEVVA